MNRLQRRASLSHGKKLMKQGWSSFEDKTLEAQMRGIKWLPGLIRVFQNNLYVVQEYEQECAWGKITHLHVRRNDEAAIRSWSDMQRIKNEIAGEERVAVEVYPSESTLVDQANNYHLWVFPEGFKLPFGLHLWRSGI